MEHLYFDNTGLLHLISSLLAVFFGTLALLLEKGTTLHKQIGYAYTLCMLIVITTAFMIYRLFGGFGMFHIAAVVSTITLIAGLYPAFFMR
ncbi:MAG: hypothetical protein H8E12_07575 [Rhodobacteraceae bacterium]|nr:hypothetical protein [Paracoccaceae bacterium]